MFFARKNIIIAVSAVLLLAAIGTACWQLAYARPRRLLARAESLMQARPDSALRTLQQLRRPQWLMGENEALYALLMTQACYKNGLPVANDSLIRIATRHYATAADPLRYAWSLFSRHGRPQRRVAPVPTGGASGGAGEKSPAFVPALPSLGASDER